jgi:3,4-dihydroxy 2-butanone 4-phosphate synthase/GTP cyclohydrolase II
MLILVDAEHRENEGDLIIAAEKITPQAINFMTQHGRGLVCMPMASSLIGKLGLSQMTEHNKSKYQTAFTVSIGAAQGITTGISAFDRAYTVQAAIADHVTPEDIVSPGHIFPLRAQEGGVLARAGHTEGCVDLAKLAGLKPAAVLCEVMNADGTMARLKELQSFAKKHKLSIINIHDLITYRMQHEMVVEQAASARLPLEKHGQFTIKVFKHRYDNAIQAVALIAARKNKSAPLVRLHSQCLTGDVFHSARCDCGWQLEEALQKISEQGGVLIYLEQEGRGIGLINKIKAYALQDKGLDTVEANQKLGFAADLRDYQFAAQILHYLHFTQIRLLTNNPDKIQALQKAGIQVIKRESLVMLATPQNKSYLKTKAVKLGHLLSSKD